VGGPGVRGVRRMAGRTLRLVVLLAWPLRLWLLGLSEDVVKRAFALGLRQGIIERAFPRRPSVLT
jgi:hypothetical protein